MKIKLTVFFITFYCLLGLFDLHLWALPQINVVKYSFLENFRGWLIRPENIPEDKKLPLIIYNYDETFDWLGEESATVHGYNLKHFMYEFTRRGYMGLIPIERYRKLNALKGAVLYAKSNPQIDSDNIHIIGVSEGGFLSLLLGRYQKDVKTISLISPKPLNDKGHFSLPELLKLSAEIPRLPVFLANGMKNRRWLRIRTEMARDVLIQNKYPLFYKEYNYARKWFWSPANPYMNDIFDFIKEHS